MTKKRKQEKTISFRVSDGIPLTRRDFDLQYCYPLPVEFPDDFAAIAGLKLVDAWIAENDITEFQILLGEVIYKHRQRYQDTVYRNSFQRGTEDRSIEKKISRKQPKIKESDYFSRVRECINALLDASASIDKASNLLTHIDISHAGLIFECAALLMEGKDNPLESGSVIEVLKELQRANCLILLLALSVQLVTSTSTAPRGRGRPYSNYDSPAADLMGLWERLTETKTVTPRTARGKKGASEGIQSSTEFVRIGLKMIDNATSSVLTTRNRMVGLSPFSLKDVFASGDINRLLRKK